MRLTDEDGRLGDGHMTSGGARDDTQPPQPLLIAASKGLVLRDLDA